MIIFSSTALREILSWYLVELVVWHVNLSCHWLIWYSAKFTLELNIEFQVMFTREINDVCGSTPLVYQFCLFVCLIVCLCVSASLSVCIYCHLCVKACPYLYCLNLSVCLSLYLIFLSHILPLCVFVNICLFVCLCLVSLNNFACHVSLTQCLLPISLYFCVCCLFVPNLLDTVVLHFFTPTFLCIIQFVIIIFCLFVCFVCCWLCSSHRQNKYRATKNSTRNKIIPLWYSILWCLCLFVSLYLHMLLSFSLTVQYTIQTLKSFTRIKHKCI